MSMTVAIYTGALLATMMFVTSCAMLKPLWA